MDHLSNDQMIYIAIAWLVCTTFLFMFLVVYISRLEIRNSQRQLNLKLAMHHAHLFHRMRIAFDKYKLRDLTLEAYHKEHMKLNEGIQILSNELSLNCENNQFLFIRKNHLRSQLTLSAKELIEMFQQWTQQIRAIDELSPNDQRAHDLLERQHNKYQAMIETVIEMYSLLSNDTYLDVIKN